MQGRSSFCHFSCPSSQQGAVPCARRGWEQCLRDMSCLFIFFLFSSLDVGFPARGAPLYSSYGGVVARMSCRRKPASLHRALGKQVGQKSPGGCCDVPHHLGKETAPHPQNITPAVWGKQEVGMVAGKQVTLGGFAATLAGTTRSPLVQGEQGLPSRPSCGILEGA